MVEEMARKESMIHSKRRVAEKALCMRVAAFDKVNQMFKDDRGPAITNGSEGRAVST